MAPPFPLLRFLYRETAGSKLRVLSTSVVSGLSRGVLLATFSGGAAPGVSAETRLQFAAGFVAALVAYLLSSYDSIREAERTVQTMVERVRLRLCAKLLLAPLRFIEANGTGDIYTQLSHDLGRLHSAAITFLNSFQASVLLVFALGYLGYLSPLGLLATICTIGAAALTYYWQDRRASSRLERARQREADFFNGVNDLLHGFKELKSSRARRSGLMAHLTGIAREYRDLNIKTETMFLVSLLTSQTFTFVLIAVLVFVLPTIFSMPGETAFQFLATILFLVGPVENLVSSIPSVSKARVSHRSIQRLEDNLDSGIATADEAGVPPPEAFDTIALRDVRFRFTGQTRHESFDVGPIDLDVRRNEILFIVGGNGAGKTTLLKLLTGLYQPSSGALLLDGNEVTAETQQAYREMFAAVFSDFHVFKRLYGLDAADGARLESLLEELHIRHKTRVEDGGLSSVDLSAGQRKRLAYAISRLFDRQIYVFDEFAADQDPAFRRYFYRELLPKLKRDGKTVIAVTHDERWFDAADRVVKMDYGRIAEISARAHAAAEVMRIG